MKKERLSFVLKNMIKGVLIAVLIAMCGILFLSLLAKLFDLSDGAIKGINQAIKILSVYIGVMYSVKGEKGFLQGLIVGLFFTVVLYLVFIIISGEITVKSFFTDILCGGIIGLISGIISVNIKRKES